MKYSKDKNGKRNDGNKVDTHYLFPRFVGEKFLSNMSARARDMFVDEMNERGPVRLIEVEEAQKMIVREARKLSDAGELRLGGGDDYV